MCDWFPRPSGATGTPPAIRALGSPCHKSTMEDAMAWVIHGQPATVDLELPLQDTHVHLRMTKVRAGTPFFSRQP
jgi:hypothetical protein